MAGAVGALVVVLFFTIPAVAIGGFGDVPADRFYAESVQWMVDNGITTGTSPGCFSPYDATTRGQAATLIHRSMGAPESGSAPFADVTPDDWFHDAVAWMAGEGITTGTSSTTFEPWRPVTRGEIAVFLHRAQGEPAAGGSVPFIDVTEADWFHDAVAWMVDAGITTGTSPTTFEPDRFLTRGEIATFLYRVAGQPDVSLTDDGICESVGLGAELAAAEAHSLLLLNELRSGLGVGSLVRLGTMDAFARDWSREMDDSDDFRHSGGPWPENIGFWSASGATPVEAAGRLHDIWAGSSGHYQNMTKPAHTQVGIGFWRSSDGWYATHVFS